MAACASEELVYYAFWLLIAPLFAVATFCIILFNTSHRIMRGV